jgi:transposase
MVAGERDPRALANLAKGRMRGKIPALTEALIGHFDADHARLAAALLHRLDHVDRAIVQLDQTIAEACRPSAHQIELLQTIPGLGEKVAQVIIAEIGGEMSQFPTAGHLAAWAGVAPGMHESAGRRRATGTRKGNKWLCAMLVEAAGSVARTRDNYLSAQPARLSARRGAGRAQMAVAHSILVCAYHILLRDEPYHDLGVDWLRRRDDQAHTRRLVAQLERLGHKVTLEPAA